MVHQSFSPSFCDKRVQRSRRIIIRQVRSEEVWIIQFSRTCWVNDIFRKAGTKQSNGYRGVERSSRQHEPVFLTHARGGYAHTRQSKLRLPSFWLLRFHYCSARRRHGYDHVGRAWRPRIQAPTTFRGLYLTKTSGSKSTRFSRCPTLDCWS
jgi:hypothetical protein